MRRITRVAVASNAPPPDVWTRLCAVTRLRLVASSAPGAEPAWTRRGAGRVAGSLLEPGVLLWHEQGAWAEAGSLRMSFQNRLRWTYHQGAGALELHHLRRGPDGLVHLATFTVAGTGGLTPREPHRCGRDVYRPRLTVTRAGLTLAWEVEGPAKRYTVLARYA